MIAIIDYDAGNLRSVEKALQYIGEEVVISRDKDTILSADKVILPGVGSFGDAMDKLTKYNLINTIYDVCDMLGIDVDKLTSLDVTSIYTKYGYDIMSKADLVLEESKRR